MACKGAGNRRQCLMAFPTPDALAEFMTRHPLMAGTHSHAAYSAWLARLLTDAGESIEPTTRWFNRGGALCGFYWKGDWWWAKGRADDDSLNRYMSHRNDLPRDEHGLCADLSWQEEALSPKVLAGRLRHLSGDDPSMVEMTQWQAQFEAWRLECDLPETEKTPDPGARTRL
jgi:hypothetical protein